MIYLNFDFGLLLVKVFIMLFVIMDSPGNIPVFMAVTKGMGLLTNQTFYLFPFVRHSNRAHSLLYSPLEMRAISYNVSSIKEVFAKQKFW